MRRRLPAMMMANGETKDERAARLAAALRDNLRRRKVQARAASAAPPPSPED